MANLAGLIPTVTGVDLTSSSAARIEDSCLGRDRDGTHLASSARVRRGCWFDRAASQSDSPHEIRRRGVDLLDVDTERPVQNSALARVVAEP